MKKSQLRQIIREEISYIFNEEDKPPTTDKKDDKCSSPEQKYIDKAKKALEANKEAWNKSSEEEKKKWIFQTAVMYCISDSGEGDSISTDELEGDLGKVGDYDSFFQCDKNEFVDNPAGLRRCIKRNKKRDSIIGSPSQWSNLIYKIKGMLKLEENKTTMKKKLLTERFQQLAGIKPLYEIYKFERWDSMDDEERINFLHQAGVVNKVDDFLFKSYDELPEFIKSEWQRSVGPVDEDSTGMVGSMYGEDEYLRHKNITSGIEINGIEVDEDTVVVEPATPNTDAYIMSAEFMDGTPLNDEQLNQLANEIELDPFTLGNR